ncbi:MAG: hypothetical protein V7711_09275 [Pseudomonadales bacterium]
MLKNAIAFVPWITSMYLLYRLDADGIWSAETSDRDLMTIAILLVGMGLSFFLLTFFSRRGGKN